MQRNDAVHRPTEGMWYFSMVVPVSAPPSAPRYRYVREPRPLHFPWEEEVPESPVHLRVRTALFLVLDGKLRGKAFVGSEQFVYWDAANPRACVAPDAFVRLGGPLTLPKTFRTWEHGAPHLAVEILSTSDARDRDQVGKLERYRRCGVREVVFFDGETDGPVLRIWDWVEGDLVERDMTDPEASRCVILGAYWRVEPDAELGLTLRLADDLEGKQLWLTADERVAELEAELARRSHK
jgi:Uma2 family endonuclease